MNGIGWLLGVSLSIGPPALPTATGRVAVHVESEHGPLADATVGAGMVRVQTNDTGDAVLVVSAGIVDLTISRDGFLSAKQRVTVASGGTVAVTIRLEPLPTV